MKNSLKNTIFITFMMLLCINTIFAQTPPQPGQGESEANPIRISSYSDLVWMSQNHQNYPGYYYRQMENIYYQWQTPFIPIGNETTPFVGHYDGNGRVLQMFELYGDYSYMGMFGVVGDLSSTIPSTIKNLGFFPQIGVNNNALTIAAGPLAGSIINTTISNIYVTGGYSTFDLLTSTGSNLSIGGVVGIMNENSVIENSSSIRFGPTGTINQNIVLNIGGIVGTITDNTSKVTNSFANLSDSFNLFGNGEINMGGVAGSANIDWLENCYWSVFADNPYVPNNIIGTLTAGEPINKHDLLTARDASSYIGWDFTGSSVWRFDRNLNFGYPYLTVIQEEFIMKTAAPRNLTFFNSSFGIVLQWDFDGDDFPGNGLYIFRNSQHIGTSYLNDGNTFTDDNIPMSLYGENLEYFVVGHYGYDYSAPTNFINFAKYDNYTLAIKPYEGTGTQADPYLIEDLHNLRWMSENPENWHQGNTTPVYFKQTEDIDASEAHSWSRPNNSIQPGGFLPIGSNTYPFIGEYDGNGKVISNLYIASDNHVPSAGLFAYTSGTTTIKNLGVENLDIQLPGITSNASIGGILGSVNGQITISNSYTTGTVVVTTSISTSGYVDLGGIVGTFPSSNSNSLIQNSYSSISFSANNNISGFVCIGGIIGFSLNDGLSNCIFNGKIQGPNERYIGGIVGYGSIPNVVNMTNNYWISESAPGLIGDTSGGGAQIILTGRLSSIEMKQQSSYEGWNFTPGEWDINPSLNYGFPYLEQFTSQMISTPTPKLLPHAFSENKPMLTWLAPDYQDTPHFDGLYDIYRNNEWIGFTDDTSYVDETVPTFDNYWYHVTARYYPDGSGPVSVKVVMFDITELDNFGSVRVGLSHTKTFDIVNSDDEAIKVKLSFVDDGNFEIVHVEEGEWEEDEITIAPNKTAKVTVKFKATSLGDKEAVLYIELVDN